MKGVRILLTLFVVLTIVFASISVFQFATHNGTTVIQSSTTVITLFTSTTITTQPLPNQGLIHIVVGGKVFTYTQWNSSTPNTFTISNVKFALLTNATGSYT